MKVSDELLFKLFDVSHLNCVEIERCRLWAETPYIFENPKFKWMYDKSMKVKVIKEL